MIELIKFQEVGGNFMSYVSTQAKMYAYPKRFGHKKTYTRVKHKTIVDCEETTFGGTLFLSKEQYEKGMALSRKMAKMSAW